MKLVTKDIALQAVITALYVGITFLTYPFSFAGIQFRIAEVFVLLCFFNKKYIIGVTLGCVLANLGSTMGPIDCLFGGLATFVSCVILAFSRKFLFPGCICCIVINAFVVGAELNYFMKEPFWISVGQVALGEFIVVAFGYVLLMVLRHRKRFTKVINANQNLEFKF